MLVGLALARWVVPAVFAPAQAVVPAGEQALAPPLDADLTPPLSPQPRPATAVSTVAVSTAATASNTSTARSSRVGPFDLDTKSGLRAAAAARAVGGEIVTFTSDVKGLPAAVNMALQLRELRIEHHMVLADSRDVCIQAHLSWAWLGCGWSAGLPGFEARYSKGVGGATAKLWSLWSAKWLLVARLTELRARQSAPAARCRGPRRYHCR